MCNFGGGALKRVITTSFDADREYEDEMSAEGNTSSGGDLSVNDEIVSVSGDAAGEESSGSDGDDEDASEAEMDEFPLVRSCGL
jgi:general stress protein YciG